MSENKYFTQKTIITKYGKLTERREKSNLYVCYYCHNSWAQHRYDGPAAIYENGKVEWWILGQPYKFDEWLKETKCSDEDKLEIVLKYA